jgi:hypothetical protein
VIWRKTPKAVIWQRRSARNSSALLSSCVIAPHDAGEADLLESVWKFGDAIEPARYLVYCRINDRLAGHVNPMIMAYRGGELLLFPDSLLTALYVLFALEVSGRARYPEIQCAGCGTTFTPSHGSQRYCVPACRKWHWDQTARKDALSQIN